MLNNLIIQGEFCVHKGVTYRALSYYDHIELFAIDDVNKKHIIEKMKKEDLEDYYYLITRCILNGINYVVRKIEDDIVTYERAVCDKKLFEIQIHNLDIIYQQKNRSGKPFERRIIYIDNNKITERYLDKNFYPEEMHNGHLMLPYLDTELDINDTCQLLKKRYGDRIKLNPPSLEMLMIDYYIATFTIDNYKFCLDYDYGIVTISPDDDGDKYILEIIEYFNNCYENKIN